MKDEKRNDRSRVLDDLRVIDMYEKATMEGRPLKKRKGNWAQKFLSVEDGTLFTDAQFHRYQEVELFIEKTFSNSKQLRTETLKKKGTEA
jgi:hypothetical protein